jgi:DNA-binding response OmpR family regulator
MVEVGHPVSLTPYVDSEGPGEPWRVHTVGVRILVVEDERRLAATLKVGLQEQGFAVDVASDGEQGLWLATDQPYDAIVLDLMLPRLDGNQVCARMRALGNWTPVLMLTAKGGEEDEAQALDTGADDYLSKPFSYVVLLAHLRALLRRGGRERPAVLTVGDLELDPAARMVRKAGQTVDLTAREFAVLEYLARYSGDVVSKTELLEHVWDFAYEGDLNVVEVHVSHLRGKIDRPFGTRTVRTVRGAGYRLVPHDA